jgi:hypothetical protein
MEAIDAAALSRMNRKRKKKTYYEDWASANDAEAEITKLKAGRTALAYKAENAVDMTTGAIVAVTTHGGTVADTAMVETTVIEAGVAVEESLHDSSLFVCGEALVNGFDEHVWGIRSVGRGELWVVIEGGARRLDLFQRLTLFDQVLNAVANDG